MATLNKDTLLLILVKLQNDNNSLYSCLLVNKTWCETTIPILWKNPWRDLPREKEKSQSNVIVSHLSNEVRENLKRKHDITLPEPMKLSFNYISFCRYLELYRLDRITITLKHIKKSKISRVRLEIIRLFINRNTRFTHLYIHRFDFQTNFIPGIEICFSKLKFLRSQPNNFLNELSGISNSIEKLELYITNYNNSDENHGITKLIKAQKNLNYISFTYEKGDMSDELLCKTLGNSLIKHVDTLKYLKIDLELFKKITKPLSCLVNLSSLEINPNRLRDWDQIENVSLPFLKFLKTQQVSTKSLISLIENTKGHLTEISIDYEDDEQNLIQAIYKNCPKLKYLKLLIRNKEFSHSIKELDNFLINCQHLNGLVISIRKNFDWDNFFKSLTRSSPNCLFKFKLFSIWDNYRSESLKLFFDNWKGRHPILLHTSLPHDEKENFDLIKKYVKEGIIKKHENDLDKTIFEDFEWIHPTHKTGSKFDFLNN
ncbi:hypothetical protein RclHR1_00590017 [Rhizophagus clarus]|uniref:F-box domain-containing protein n=1 Tax=Rhizophagus clarus TaxID=94130 RepID=A0A2Z6RRA6_9GLOM|nr:hypothetical protein RclHR1_00590017 [Rhizophagus clarus]GES92476.1 hypothetical protein GLOIN_2v1764019 [Rhizophagus clarus]